MRLSDIQPQYFPRMHYIARMLESDVFVFRDDVQFVRNHRYPDGSRGPSYQAHTPIKSPDGAYLVTVGVKKGGQPAIADTEISYDHKWPQKHLNVIKQFYRKSPNLRALMPEIEALVKRRFRTLAELNVATACWALGHLLGLELRVPSDLCVERVNERLAAAAPARLRRIGLGSRLLSSSAASTPSERIAELCKIAEVDEYLGGGTAVKAYLDPRPFEREGIELAVQDWTSPSYAQQHPKAGHLADPSILDLLMNAPLESAASLVLGRPLDAR